MTIRLLAISSLLVASALPGACGDVSESSGQDGEGLDADARLLLTLDDFRGALETGHVLEALARVDDDFINQGRDKGALQLWAQGLEDEEALLVAFEQAEISVDEESGAGLVDHIVHIEACEDTIELPGPSEGSEPRAVPEPTTSCTTVERCDARGDRACSWARRWLDGEGGWSLVGDGSPFGFDLALRAEADGLSLAGSIYDPQARLDGAAITWAGTGEPALTLEAVGATLFGVPESAGVPAVLYPASAPPWTLEVALDGDADPPLVELTFVSVMDTFPAELLPDGEAVAPYELSWSSEAAGGFEVRILDGDGGTVWTSPRVFESSMDYAGPTLTPGSSYQWEVSAFDLHGHHAVTRAALQPLDGSDVDPDPTSISPTTGAAAGGEDVVIFGSGFLVGVRVEIGSEECVKVVRADETELHCVTPVLDPGVHHVTVINPAGGVGLLEDAFTAF